MRKMKNVLVAIVLFAVIVSFAPISNALTLVLTTGASAQEINVGSNVTITVDWKEGMQAADFVLKYDSSKLEYQSSSINDSFIRATNGEVRVAWFSTSGDENLDKATFTFKGKSAGEATFSTKIDGGFSNKNLTQPDEYNVESTATVTILGTSDDSDDSDSNNPGTDDGTGDSGNDGSGSDGSGTGGTGNSGSGNGGSSSGGSKPSGSGSNSSKPSGTPSGGGAPAATNPAQMPTSLPKAGGKNILIALPLILIVMCVSYYKLKEYKDV